MGCSEVPVRLAPEIAAPTGGRVYVVWRIPGRPGLHGIFYCRGYSDLEVTVHQQLNSSGFAAVPLNGNVGPLKGTAATPDEFGPLHKALVANGCMASSGIWLKRVMHHNCALDIYRRGGSNGNFRDGLPNQPLRWLVGGL
jgi:hypothetical protein